VKFAKGVVCEGKVEFVNTRQEPRLVPPGYYKNQTVQL